MAHLHSHQAAMAGLAHPHSHLSPSAASDVSSHRSSSGLGSDRGAPSPAESYNSSHATSVSSHRSCSPQFKTEGGQGSSTGGASRAGADEKETFACQWNGCRLVFDDADAIYRHLCDDHVGRKSTGNLTLTCAWGDCDVSAAKRDHLTSHLRVHVPLKPHACPICNKNFKRPQDLKKHERIHTEQLPDQRDAHGHPFMGYGVPGAHGFGAIPPGYAPAYPDTFNTGQYYSPGSGYPTLPGMGSARVSNASAYSASTRGMPDMVPSSSFSPASSSASPHSSHLESPASHPYSSYMGNANRSALDQYSIHRTAVAGRTSDTYLDYAHDRPHLDTDLSTYSGLATGTKRSYDATRDFVEDVSNKMLKPDYTSDMAARLSNTFNSGILDEASLSALLATFSGQAQHPIAPAPSAHSAQASILMHDAQHQERKPDLADVNAFLLQLGRSAATGQEHHAPQHHQQSSQVAPTAASSSTSDLFDPDTLAALGLDQIPGFDMFQASGNQQQGVSWGVQPNTHHNRPIAQMPSRHSGAADPSASYDRVRSQHGHALVPQLAPKEFNYANLRRVEPLTRAAPSRLDARPNVERLPRGKASAESDDEMGDAESSSTKSASTGPDSTDGARELPSLPSMGIYPRVAMGDLSRRLPTPTSSERGSSASIGSILHAGASKGHGAAHRAVPYAPRRRQTSEGMSSPSPPPTESASSPRSTAGSIDEASSPDVYPRLPAQGMDGIAADVAALRGLGQQKASPAADASSEAVSAATRARHVQLIRDLLLAINFPERFRARLAPINPRASGSDSDEDIKARTLPPLRLPVEASPEHRRMSVASATDSSSSQEPDSERHDGRRSVTPTPTVRTRTMPAISSLLNAADDTPAPRLVNEGRRHMEVDV